MGSQMNSASSDQHPANGNTTPPPVAAEIGSLPPQPAGEYVDRPLEKGYSLSYWLQGVRHDPLLDHRSTTELPQWADIVVIGSGISGTVVANELVSPLYPLPPPPESWTPPESVLVLEAREFCSGATGRNAGHCKPDQWRGFGKYSKTVGPQQAKEILDNEYETWKRLVDYIRENNVDCDLWVGKTLDTPLTDETAAETTQIWNSYKAYLEQTGSTEAIEGIEFIEDREDARKRSRLNEARKVWAWDASTLYPWKLAAHIMRRAIKTGKVNLQTWTPVLSVVRGENQTSETPIWKITTPRGTVLTKTVVHTTNANAGAILNDMRGVIRPTAHLCQRVIPPPSHSGSKAIQNSYGVILPSGALISVNSRVTSDGSILFGGSNPNHHHLMKYMDEVPERRADDGLSDRVPPAPKKPLEKLNGGSDKGPEEDYFERVAARHLSRRLDRSSGEGARVANKVGESVRKFVKENMGWEGWGVEGEYGGEWEEGTSIGSGGSDWSWSGIIGRSADGLPFVGALPQSEFPNQFISAGHHGHGMARIMTTSPCLVKLIQGLPWEEARKTGCLNGRKPVNEHDDGRLQKLVGREFVPGNWGQVPDCYRFTQERLDNIRKEKSRNFSVGVI